MRISFVMHLTVFMNEYIFCIYGTGNAVQSLASSSFIYDDNTIIVLGIYYFIYSLFSNYSFFFLSKKSLTF